MSLLTQVDAAQGRAHGRHQQLRVKGHAPRVRDLREPAGAGDAAVAGKGPHDAAGAELAADHAGAEGDPEQEDEGKGAARRRRRLPEQLGQRQPRRRVGECCVVLDRKHERNQVRQTGDKGNQERAEQRERRVARRVRHLFGDVRDAVETSEGIQGVDEATASCQQISLMFQGLRT